MSVLTTTNLLQVTLSCGSVLQGPNNKLFTEETDDAAKCKKKCKDTKNCKDIVLAAKEKKCWGVADDSDKTFVPTADMKIMTA